MKKATLKRERDALQDKCDELQAMVGSLKLQLCLYAHIMNEQYQAERKRKKNKIHIV